MSLEVRRSPRGAEEARAAVDALGPLLTDAALYDAKVVISELVSNSVRYGQGETVRISLALGRDGTLRGEVVDDGHGFVSPTSPPAHGPPDGLGLPMVDALVENWGVQEGSTHVWFEMSGAAARRGNASPRLGAKTDAVAARVAPLRPAISDGTAAKTTASHRPPAAWRQEHRIAFWVLFV